MTLTFVDAGVLIAAARGQDPQSEAALRILEDPGRRFVSSPFLRLEVLPQATFHRRDAEVAFYETYFAATVDAAFDFERVVRDALREASTFGVEAVDALHVAAAAAAGADELVTTEKPSRSIHRARSVRVVSLRPA